MCVTNMDDSDSDNFKLKVIGPLLIGLLIGSKNAAKHVVVKDQCDHQSLQP